MMLVVLDVVYDAISPCTDPLQLRVLVKLFTIPRQWIVFEGCNLIEDLSLQILREVANELFGLRFEFYSVHRSQSSDVQLSLQIIKVYPLWFSHRIK